MHPSPRSFTSSLRAAFDDAPAKNNMENAMHGPSEQRIPAEQRASNELVRLIPKLRWIGMDDEAEALAEELARRRATDTLSVVSHTRETD